MLPNIRIAGFSIHTYWLTLGIGTLGMLYCILRRRDRFALPRIKSVLITAILTAVGVAGAMLLFVLENGLPAGGFSFFGSVFLIPLLMPLAGRLFRLTCAQTLDICAPCVAVMIGCMRFGCFLCGCCGGWEVCIGELCFAWPTQAVESIGDFVILGLLLKWGEADRYTSHLYPMFMLLYGVMRFYIEFFRDTPKDWLYLSHGQWFSLIAIVVGALWVFLTKKDIAA